jgi:alpha-galactosidase
MIGCDIRKLDTDSTSLLMNREVLDINQDALGIPAGRVKQIGSCDIWAIRLADNGTAVSVTNRGSSAQDLSLRARDIGLHDTPKLARNVWLGEDIADFKTELPLTIKPHETILLKVTS